MSKKTFKLGWLGSYPHVTIDTSNQRVDFYSGILTTKSISAEQISGMSSQKRGLFSEWIVVYSNGVEAFRVKTGSASYDNIQACMTYIKALKPKFVPTNQVSNAQSEPMKANKLDSLERLAKLKESGALTEAEFDSEKKKLLAS